MVARAIWLWLCASWLMSWLTEAIISTSTGSTCDLGPCTCNRGKLLCDCTPSKVKEVFLRGLAENRFSSISVTNCSHVHVTSQALSGLPALQQVSFTAIPRLILEEEALSWSTENHQHSGLLVNITDCSIPVIPSYCFRGSLRDVVISSTNVSRLLAFAFASINHAEKIGFNRVNFASVEPQSFKKFSVDVFSISDSSFDVLPTRTMVDVEVHREVKIAKVKVNAIENSALKIHGPRHFYLTESSFNYIEHQGFHIHTRGSVFINDNAFLYVEKAGFSGITVERRFLQEFGKQDLTFQNNTLMKFESAPLIFNISGFNPKLEKIMINQKCSCPDAVYWSSDLVYFLSDSHMIKPAPHVSTVMYCHNANAITNVKDYQRLFCNVRDSSTFLTLALISGSVISISVLILLVYCGFKKKTKRYTNVPNSPSPLKLNKNHVLVIPDGKTYRETELHVIVEHTEPIIVAGYTGTNCQVNSNTRE